jgi:hypothetical protein
LNPGHPPRQDGALPLSYVPTDDSPIGEGDLTNKKIQ